MKQSESIAELAAALSKAQGVMSGVIKDASNPIYNSKYATLAASWDAVRGALSANGLAIVQTCDNGDNSIIVETTLLHSSGQWVSGSISGGTVKADPQGIGSLITYFRRYGLQAICGLAPEDDDGNAATIIQPNIPPSASPVRRTAKPDEDVPDFEPPATVKSLKTNLSNLMAGYTADEKKAFFDYLVKGKEVSITLLEDIITHYEERRSAYMRGLDGGAGWTSQGGVKE